MMACMPRTRVDVQKILYQLLNVSTTKQRPAQFFLPGRVLSEISTVVDEGIASRTPTKRNTGIKTRVFAAFI